MQIRWIWTSIVSCDTNRIRVGFILVFGILPIIRQLTQGPD